MAKEHPEQVRIDGVAIPKKVGHDFTPMWVKPLSFIFSEEARIHRRLHVFHYKGVKCANPSCKRQGYYVIAGRDRFGGVHIDLYTKDFVLMTVDHIHALSKGGSNALHNKQPMCDPCNSRKGAKPMQSLVVASPAPTTKPI